MLHSITLPRVIQTTASACDDLPDLLRRAGYYVPLLITDRVSAALGIAEPFCQRLDQHQVLHDVFSDVDANASLNNMIAGMHKVLSGCSSLYPDPFDCIVALGGTSVMDVAKGISVAATNGGSLQRPRHKRDASLPIIAIPTTDSISEFTDHTILMDNGSPIPFNHSAPVAVLLDSELIATMPSLTSRATALSTLSYAIEAFTSPNASLFSHQQTLAALRLIRHNITSDMTQPPHSESRQEMTLAARLAGIAFNATGGGLLHHMTHVLSVAFEIEQPICRAMLLAPITEYQAITSPKPYAECAATLGITHSGDAEINAVHTFIRHLKKLYSSAQLPKLRHFVSYPSHYQAQIDTMTEGVCAALATTGETKAHPPANIRQLFQNLWY